MEITLNNVKSLDHLKSIIATKYPSVKMHSDYLSLKYQGVKLTIEPKENGAYDINRDIPILKGLLLGVIIILVVFALFDLISDLPIAYLLNPNVLASICIVIFLFIGGLFLAKPKQTIAGFCQELIHMCNDKDITEKLMNNNPNNSEQFRVQKKILIRNIIIALIAAIAFISLYYFKSNDDVIVDNQMFLCLSFLCASYSVYQLIKLLLLKRKHKKETETRPS